MSKKPKQFQYNVHPKPEQPMPRLGYFRKVHHTGVENYIPFLNKRDYYTTKDAQFRIKTLSPFLFASCE